MSTYSTNLKIELIGTGEQAGTWGVTTDDNFSNVFEQSIVGRVSVPFTDADVTLTATNSVSSQSFRNVYLNCTGTNTASRNLIVPTINKNYVVQNNTTGGFNIVIKTTAGTGITVPNGKTCTVYADGTNVIQAFDYLPVATVGTLTITSITAGSITDTGLTSGRVTYAGTGGLLTDSANFIFDGTNVGIGISTPSSYSKLSVLGAVTSGEQSSTSGSTLLRGYYPVGALTVIGTEFSSGGPVIGYGVTGSKSAEGSFESTTTANLPRSAFYMDGSNFRFYSGGAQTTAIGSTATLSETMRLDSNGYLGIGTSSPSAILDVNGSSRVRGTISAYTTASDRYSIIPQAAGSGIICSTVDNAFTVYTPNTNDASYFVWRPAGTERMRITSAGLLGIGTSSPNALLDVTGGVGTFNSTIYTQSSTADMGIAVFSSNNAGTPSIRLLNGLNSARIFLAGNGNGDLNFTAPWNGTTPNVTFSGGGNVGIGTSSPSFSGGSRKALTLNAPTGQLSIFELGVNGTLTGYMYANASQMTLDSINNPMTFQTSGAERMRIDSNGRVQIGASNPASTQFSVQGGSGSSAVAYFGSSDANLTAMAVRNDPSSNTTMLSSEWSSTATNLLFGIGGTERMRITTSGDVVVGTTSSYGAKFAVNRPASNSLLGLFSGDNFDGNTDGVVVTYNGAGAANYRVKAYMVGYNGYVDLRDGGNNTVTRITASSVTPSFLNAGTTTGALLYLGATTQTQVGSIDFFKSGNGAGSAGLIAFNASGTSNYPLIFRYNGSDVGYITYTNTAVAYVSLSDYRLKENIVPMTGALDKVKALNPVTYKWKVDGSDGQGFIAHELAQVVPDCVSGKKDAIDENGKPKYQGIDTSFLVATLTAAIQEQQALINNLTTRLNALEGK